MDANETKQWIISRIDNKHANYLEELGINEGRYDQWSEAIERWAKNGRNYVFSVLGGGLSVLLGLLSKNWLEPLWVIFSLAIIVIFAVLTFSISNKVAGLLTRFTYSISQFAIDGQDRISYSRNHFTSLTADIDKLNAEDLRIYSIFVEILLNATLIPIFIEYSQFMKAKWMPKETAESIKDNINSLKKQVEEASKAFTTAKSSILPAPLVDYIKTQFVEYDKFMKSIV